MANYLIYFNTVVEFFPLQMRRLIIRIQVCCSKLLKICHGQASKQVYMTPTHTPSPTVYSDSQQALKPSIYTIYVVGTGGFPGGAVVKNLPASAGDVRDTVQSLGQEDLLGKEMATTLVFLPGKSHGQRNLAGYSLWDCRESDRFCN